MVRIITSKTDMSTFDVDEVIEIIEACADCSGEDIWLHANGGEPSLAIAVYCRLACIHYFQGMDGPMWESVGSHSEDIEFPYEGDIMLMAANAILPIEKAIEAAREFCNTYGRPTCIEWRDL